MTLTFDLAKFQEFALARLKERSTWLGFIAILSAAGLTISPDAVEMIAATGSGIAGLVLVFTSDKKKAAPAATEMGAGKNS
jgi:hypothetical protein